MRFVPGNHLRLLCNGEEYFPALLAAVDEARAEVFLETYIFADDETGSMVADALARAEDQYIGPGAPKHIVEARREIARAKPVEQQMYRHPR